MQNKKRFGILCAFLTFDELQSVTGLPATGNF